MLEGCLSKPMHRSECVCETCTDWMQRRIADQATEIRGLRAALTSIVDKVPGSYEASIVKQALEH